MPVSSLSRYWKRSLALGLGAMTLSPSLHAEYLYGTFPNPGGGPDYLFRQAPVATYRNVWDVMYTPYGSPNYPDITGVYGNYGPASLGGLTPPANSSPSAPNAFFDIRNPSITQTGTNSAFIISPTVDGNIYSFTAPTTFQLSSGAGDLPYTPLTVLFQTQTLGSTMDFNSVVLQYTNTSNQTFSITATQYLKEYQSGGASGMGLSVSNRLAFQWDLSGLNVKSYKILFGSTSPSMSFQEAQLNTDDTVFNALPNARTWTSTTNGALWNTGSNWAQGTSSIENGNVFFNTSSAANLSLNGNHTVAEMVFQSAPNVTISTSTGSAFTSNTGISTTSAATGVYTVNPNFAFSAYNVFDIEAGTVKMNGVLSGNYGMFKTGAGTLELNNSNTFTGSLSMEGGTLRLTGTNAYTGGTAIVYGTAIAAGNAPASGLGVFGNDSTNISLGADSALYANQPLPSPAGIIIDGDYTIARGITMAPGTHQKILGAQNTTNGATFSGNINLGTSTDVHFRAVNASDKVTFTSGLTGGVAGTLPAPSAITIDGQGTVVYGGTSTTYSYANDTKVTSGTLKIDTGASFTGNGAFSVASGSKLIVNGSLAGTGALDLHGTLGGSGTIGRAFTVDSTSILSPGNSTGTLTTGNETWASGGTLKFQLANATGVQGGTGWDFLQINGTLNVTATALNAFHIDLDSLGLDQLPGLAQNFNPSSNGSWKIATATGGITNFNASAFMVDNQDFLNAVNGNFSIGKTGNDIYLLYTVPEPSTYFLLVCGMGLLFWQYRRQTAR